MRGRFGSVRFGIPLRDSFWACKGDGGLEWRTGIGFWVGTVALLYMRNEYHELLLKLLTGLVKQLILRGILFCHE
jgi:hypothetical protein